MSAHDVKKALLPLLILLLPALAACRQPAQTDCSETPPFEQTAEVLARCLPLDFSAPDFERQLQAWERINAEVGGVDAADLLPGGGEEIILRYHADLQSAAWDPQGALAVLQRGEDTWRLRFDAAEVEVEGPDGTVRMNWSYEIVEAADATGDGLEELLVELVYHNGVHLVLNYFMVLTGHESGTGAGLHVAYLEEVPGDLTTYRVVDRGRQKVLQAAIGTGREPEAIRRTYAYDAAGQGGFSLVDQEIEPALSSVSAQTPDGSSWYAFDTFDGGGGSPPGSPLLGLYRVRDGRIVHFEVPDVIRVLTVAPDGDLYVGAGCGILVYREEQLESVVDIECGGEKPFKGTPVDMAFAGNGDLWVGTGFSLARFDGATWTSYDVRARRLLVTDDGSVWAQGWDGKPGADCCLSRISGGEAVTYPYSATLPVSTDLQEEIRRTLLGE